MKKNIILIIILIVVDQIIKFAVYNTMGNLGYSITLIPNILELSYVENTGGVFGIFSPRVFLITIDVLILFVIIKLLLNKKYELNQKAKLGLSLILAGGTGNLIDRIFRGHVVDYLDITKMFDFPVFNFADICVIVGVILVFLVIIINTIKSQENINEQVQSKREQ